MQVGSLISSRFTELVGVPPSTYRRDAARPTARMPSRGETGDQTDQESRSAGHRAATTMTAMEITIQATFFPRDDPNASLVLYRDALGFEVRNDVVHAQTAP